MDLDFSMNLEGDNNSESEAEMKIDCVYETKINCESKESFYYAISLYLTRPETVWTKYIFSSFIHNLTVELDNTSQSGDGTVEVEIERLEKAYHNIFYLPMKRSSIQEVFDNQNLRRIYVDRLMIIRNKAESQVLLTEIWDFKSFTVTINPKDRADLKSLNHQILEAEIPYSKNICLLRTEFQFVPETQEVVVKAFGTRMDAKNSLVSFKRVLERITPWFRRSYQNWVSAEDNLFRIPSLSAVDRSNYFSIYQSLKLKYFAKAFTIWENSNEKTDGNKFIHEDLHVASYLICMESSSNSCGSIKRKFVELACGNGLLTYILCSEGWEGYGLDTRERKIWTHFPGMENKLRVKTVTMENMEELEGIDNETLIIGNHPDQLSPLIPIITWKRNAGGFIVIPCCPYDIYGNKATRANGKLGSKISAYESHVMEVYQFSQKIGFHTTLDKLRLPSTKRIGILGSRLNPSSIPPIPLDNDFQVDTIIRNIIQAARNNSGSVPAPGIISKPQNCSSLPRDKVEGLVLKIFQYMLSHHCQNPYKCFDSQKTPKIFPSWNSGCRQIKLKMIVELLEPGDLELLKSQNKGVQTLLRNYHQVFGFENGNVFIRIPRKDELGQMLKEGKGNCLRKTQCFFEKHHPNSCPLASSECTYLHSNSE